MLAAEAALGITAGLQDRVVQTYEGVVYMDFDEAGLKARGHGEYTPLDPDTLPQLWCVCHVSAAPLRCALLQNKAQAQLLLAQAGVV